VYKTRWSRFLDASRVKREKLRVREPTNTVCAHYTASFSGTFKFHNYNTMAGDTRDSSSTQPQPRGPPPGATAPPEHVKNPKVYEVFNAPANANSLPAGSGQNTAGGRPENPSLTEGIKTVRLADFKQVHQYPCVREALLTGIGGGFGMGAIRAVWGSKRHHALRCSHSMYISSATC
jgi:hypothetical protein